MKFSDDDILELLIKIGFTLHKEDNTGIGDLKEFKYYPDYISDNHYTLVTFNYTNCFHALSQLATNPSGTEFRLYVHRNIDNSFVSSPFQCRNPYTYIKEIFKSELREIKLNMIYNESSM
jgi:hypothetical protein